MNLPPPQSSREKLDQPSTNHDSIAGLSEAVDIIAPLSPMSLGTLFLRIVFNVIDESILSPPSFAESQFATIVRRQRPRDTALKISNVPTRYPNLSQDFEFAGYVRWVWMG
jgi:hypothetical protein